MLHKTRGLVLHHIKYSESSLIVKIYTEEFGLQSYLVKGARSKKATLRSSIFQPLTLLDMVVYHRANNDLQHIREADVAEPFHSISSDLRKSTIAIFLSELLIKSLSDSEVSEDLFEFLSSSLHYFDMQEDGVENFHLYFMLKLSRYLGFHPQGNPQGGRSIFDLREGKFVMQSTHPDRIEGDIAMAFFALSNYNASELNTISIPKLIRLELLDTLLMYYQIHLPGLGNIKSLEVLREVFN